MSPKLKELLTEVSNQFFEEYKTGSKIVLTVKKGEVDVATYSTGTRSLNTGIISFKERDLEQSEYFWRKVLE